MPKTVSWQDLCGIFSVWNAVQNALERTIMVIKRARKTLEFTIDKHAKSRLKMMNVEPSSARNGVVARSMAKT